MHGVGGARVMSSPGRDNEMKELDFDIAWRERAKLTGRHDKRKLIVGNNLNGIDDGVPGRIATVERRGTSRCGAIRA